MISSRSYSSLPKICKISDHFNHPRLRINPKIPSNGLLNVKGLTNPHAFVDLTHRTLSDSKKLVHELLSNNRSRKFVQILDDVSNTICKTADMADCIRILHPDPIYREKATYCCYFLTEFVEELNTNSQLYENSVSVFENSSENDVLDKRVLELFINDFQQSGVQLKDEKLYARFIEANKQIFHFGNNFFNNSHASVSENKNDLSLNSPTFYNANSNSRRISYLNFYEPIFNQEFTLKKLLYFRHELALSSGFDCYSSRILLNTMIDNCYEVDKFLHDSLKNISRICEKTVETIHHNFSQNLDPLVPTNKLANWDIPYAIHLDHLSLGSCMHGVALLAECLFNLKMIPEEVDDLELPHPDVIKIKIYKSDRTQKNVDDFVGTVYCDFFQRDGKPFQDCHYTIQGGKYLDREERYQDPIVYLQLNFPKYSDRPTLLDFDQVENLFHEWGHAFHSMLAKTRYQHVTGTRCSTDLAEIPSTLFEILATHPRIISEYARNWRTGRSLENAHEIFQQIHSARSFGQSIETSQQLLLATLDQQLHRGIRAYIDVEEAETTSYSLHRRLCGDYLSWNYPATKSATAYTHRFTHLYNYGSKYHSYQVAKSAAYLIYSKFFDKDPWNSSGGEKLVENFLRRGGEQEGISMISHLLGDTITVEDLSRCLVDETMKREEIAQLSNR